MNGRDVRIDSGFRMGVAIEMELLSGEPDAAGLLTAFYPEGVPQPYEEAAERMIWFYTGRDVPESRIDAGADEKPRARAYDFGQDADALLASFLDAYNIDLTSAQLHWWTFRRLMMNLPPDTPFMKRIHYRTADLKKLGKEERKHYKKMRALYALKRPEGPAMTVEERDAALKEKVRRRFEEAQRQTQEV